MIIGSDSKRTLIFKSSPETKWKFRQLYLNGNIYLIKQIECDHMSRREREREREGIRERERGNKRERERERERESVFERPRFVPMHAKLFRFSAS